MEREIKGGYVLFIVLCVLLKYPNAICWTICLAELWLAEVSQACLPTYLSHLFVELSVLQIYSCYWALSCCTLWLAEPHVLLKSPAEFSDLLYYISYWTLCPAEVSQHSFSWKTLSLFFLRKKTNNVTDSFV